MVADGKVTSRIGMGLVVGTLLVGAPLPAHAFNPFGLFGESKPAVTPNAVASKE